jgi:formate hydrogenlyase subunit 6/NADH:ubiquinone oxidoreductase subunit I
MKYPKLRELAEAIKAVIKGPYTSKFPVEPHVPHPNFRGQPEFDQDKCLGCLACEEACPSAAIGHQDILDGEDFPKRVMIHYTDDCIFCGVCQDACMRETGDKAIVLGNKWELSYFDRSQAFETIEKELQLCEVCGDVIATKDHLVYIAEKLGELSFSNPTLYMARLREMGLADDNIQAVLADNGRSDRVKILCAECRRKTAIYEE